MVEIEDMVKTAMFLVSDDSNMIAVKQLLWMVDDQSYM